MTPALESEFAREVRAGLGTFAQKTLPCRYLYDDVGSALFEAITCLDEYGLTRADARILRAHAAEITACLAAPLMVAELGSGSGIKTRPVIASLPAPVRYFPIDLSASALANCARELAPLADVFPIEADYLAGLAEVAARRRPGEKILLLFLGSTIGNFEPAAAADFLAALRSLLAPGDGLLLGADLVKSHARLLAAYDDPAGVTAAFNLNLLARINRELAADFRLRQFHHEARYNAAAQRVEMHLRSRIHQTVHIEEAHLTVEFGAGETILTEVCHKFHPAQIAALACAAGFQTERQWTDEEWGFAETLLRA